MPRPSEIQAEEAVPPRSPLRRSCRIVAVSSTVPEPKQVKGRRSSTTTVDNKDGEASGEPRAVRATRASSVTKDTPDSKHEPVKTRARRSSVTSEQPELEITKPVKGRRSSITTEEEKKPVRGRRGSIQEDKDEDSVKKPIRGRRGSLQEEESLPRSIRSTRSASKDLFDGNEESTIQIEKEMEIPEKRITRRASIESTEEIKIQKPVKTPNKPKRRLSISENAAILEPIYESPNKTDVKLIDMKGKTQLSETINILDLSVINESSFTEETGESSKNLKENIKTIDSPKSEKNSTSLKLSPGKPIVLLNKLEENEERPETPTRKSPRLMLKKCQSGDVHTHRKCDCENSQTDEVKGKKIDFNKSRDVDLKNQSTESPSKQIATEIKLKEALVKIEKLSETSTVAKRNISEDSDGLILSENKFDSTENVTELNDSKSSVNSDKENIAENVDKDTSVQKIHKQNITVARVSNVFRPKDIDYSFMEAMDVDTTIDTSKLDKSYFNKTKLHMTEINESIDETLSLNLSVTQCETPEKEELAEVITKLEESQPNDSKLKEDTNVTVKEQLSSQPTEENKTLDEPQPDIKYLSPNEKKTEHTSPTAIGKEKNHAVETKAIIQPNTLSEEDDDDDDVFEEKDIKDMSDDYEFQLLSEDEEIEVEKIEENNSEELKDNLEKESNIEPIEETTTKETQPDTKDNKKDSVEDEEVEVEIAQPDKVSEVLEKNIIDEDPKEQIHIMENSFKDIVKDQEAIDDQLEIEQADKEISNTVNISTDEILDGTGKNNTLELNNSTEKNVSVETRDNNNKNKKRKSNTLELNVSTNTNKSVEIMDDTDKNKKSKNTTLELNNSTEKNISVEILDNTVNVSTDKNESIEIINDTDKNTTLGLNNSTDKNMSVEILDNTGTNKKHKGNTLKLNVSTDKNKSIEIIDDTDKNKEPKNTTLELNNSTEKNISVKILDNTGTNKKRKSNTLELNVSTNTNKSVEIIDDTDKNKKPKNTALELNINTDKNKSIEILDDTDKNKKRKSNTLELNVSTDKNKSVEILDDTGNKKHKSNTLELNVSMDNKNKSMENHNTSKNKRKSTKLELNNSSDNKSKSEDNIAKNQELIKGNKSPKLSLEEFANSKLDEFLERKLNDFETDEEEVFSDEDSEDDNSYIDDMAEEGEEDTPSEDSNAIIDVGESIHSDSDRSEDDYDENDDSFVSDEENFELLSGEEYDLGDGRRKSRILNVENRNEDIIKIERKSKVKPKKKNTRIIKLDDSSSDEEIINLDSSNTQTSSINKPINKNENRGRKSSINIIENIDVKEIKDTTLSDRINQLVDTFCTTIPQEGGISMNISLEYEQTSLEADRSTKIKKEATKRKSMSNENYTPSKEPKLGDNKDQKVGSSNKEDKKRKKKKVKKLKQKKSNSSLDLSSEDLKEQTYGLMVQLFNDVKNRPRRLVNPSTTNLEDTNTWQVGNEVEMKPSTSSVSLKEIEDFKKKKLHPKDFRNQMLTDSSRVKRMETKQLLKKRLTPY